MYTINTDIELKYPQLITLIKNTESMDIKEKQHRFDLLPTMEDKHIDRLYEILETERVKLENLENTYKDLISNLRMLGNQK